MPLNNDFCFQSFFYWTEKVGLAINAISEVLYIS